MKFGAVAVGGVVLCILGILIFFGMRSCDTLPTEVLKVGRTKGVFLGTSSDLHDGFNFDLAQFLGQKLHKKVVFKDMDWQDLIPALYRGEVDILCDSLNITDERKKKVAMIHVLGGAYPYLELLFWDDAHKKTLEHVKHVKDVREFFEHHSIGVAIRGTIWINLLKKYGIKNIKSYENERCMVSALRNGEVSALVFGRISTDFLKNQYSNIFALKVSLDEPYSYGIGVALDNQRPELIKQVANAIQDLKDEGMINLWQQKWFGRLY